MSDLILYHKLEVKLFSDFAAGHQVLQEVGDKTPYFSDFGNGGGSQSQQILDPTRRTAGTY
jgi:hypothetical protein